MHANPMLRGLPLSSDFEIIDTDDGITSAPAIPCIARNMMSSMPVLARPLARMKMERKKLPTRFTDLGPMTSAMVPARSKQEPLVRK